MNGEIEFEINFDEEIISANDIKNCWKEEEDLLE